MSKGKPTAAEASTASPQSTAATSASSASSASPSKAPDMFAAIGDNPKAKGLLDDAVHDLVSELEFTEDHRYSNIKILVGIVSIALALLAQCYPSPFRPLPFPEAKPLYIFCVGCYFLLSVFLTAMATLYEKDSIIFTKADKKWKTPIRINTDLARFSTEYVVKIVNRTSKTTLKEHTFDISNYFEESGKFHPEFFKEDMRPLLKGIEKSD